MKIICNQRLNFILFFLVIATVVGYLAGQNSTLVKTIKYQNNRYYSSFQYNLSKLNYGLFHSFNSSGFPRASNGLIAVRPKDLTSIKVGRKYGYVDAAGKMVIPAVFDSYAEFKGEFAKLRFKNKYGVINILGEMVIPFDFDDIKSPVILDRGYLIANKNGKEGIIDSRGKTIVPFKFDRFIAYSQTSMVVQNEGEIGYVDRQHKFVPLKEQNSQNSKVFSISR